MLIACKVFKGLQHVSECLHLMRVVKVRLHDKLALLFDTGFRSRDGLFYGAHDQMYRRIKPEGLSTPMASRSRIRR